jgi:hypothetical protein
MLWLAILVGTIIGATVHCLVRRQRGAAVEVYLVYLLVGYYGLAMVLAALVHLTNPAGIAQLKGWVSSEPIQTLYAYALLGMALSSMLTVWMRGTFAWGKDGLEFLFDSVVPTTVLFLAWLHWRGERRRRTRG